MAHNMLFTMGYNAPEDALLPADFDWTQPDVLAEAYRKMAQALRPWTIDFHVAQNDGTVKGSGSHDKTGRHCQPLDPNGKLDIVRDAGVVDARRRRTAHPRLPAHLLGRLHVPQRGDARPEDLERRAAGDDRGKGRARVELTMKKLNIGLIGYGFMGRAHSNAFRKVSNFFELPYQPVLKTICARNAERGKAFAAQWGYENAGDGLAQGGELAGYRPDRYREP